MTAVPTTTIAAIATPPGQGGVGIVRISGPKAYVIAQSILNFEPKPRIAHFAPFLNAEQQPIDEGIAIYFKAPHSFTGEDVLELQGHGGPVVLNMLLARAFELGAMPAQAGEFTSRAFLNDKLDLAQAEAVSDLIHAQTEQAAKNAMQSLRGAFSQRCDALKQRMIDLRVFVEAAIDFPDEELDILSDGQVQSALETLKQDVSRLLDEAKQGAILQTGLTVAIAGKPNAGKSSLLNVLAGDEVAIVTDIPGTTRDALKLSIQIDGLVVHIVDTAGLRDTDDIVEREGVSRAKKHMAQADYTLWVADSTQADALDGCPDTNCLVVWNKIDLVRDCRAPSGLAMTNVSRHCEERSDEAISISTKTGEGVDDLKLALKKRMGVSDTLTDTFSARKRHVDAIGRSGQHVLDAHQQLTVAGALELVAHELKSAHDALSEVVGGMTSDALLGEIFSSFCIGK